MGPNWPLWITDTTVKGRLGEPVYKYEGNPDLRNKDNYPLGPEYNSDLESYSVFKDTDTNYFQNTTQPGHPLGLEIEERLYLFDNPDMEDNIIISYDISNKSKDTLYDCYVGGVYDPDVKIQQNGETGWYNDFARYVSEYKDLNLAAARSYNSYGDSTLGYLGIALLESPSVDENNFVKNSNVFYPVKSQLGMTTFCIYTSSKDTRKELVRYEMLSTPILNITTIMET